MSALSTIADIKAAVDRGDDVRCDGGGYVVIKDKLGQYLITFEATDYCVGLHGCAGTKYADKLNGRDFHIRKSQAVAPTLPREHAIETALSWANQHGYSYSYVALDTYCGARGLEWRADPMHNYIIYTEKG